MQPQHTTKRCTKCGEPRPTVEFNHDVRYTDGYYPWCAACRRAYRQQRKADPVKHRADLDNSLRHYHSKPAYKERRRQYDRERWHNDPDYRAHKNAWKRNRWHTDTRFRRKRQQWAKAIHERKKHDPAYQDQRRKQAILDSHRRRARLAGGGSFTRDEWLMMCEQYNHRCVCCGKRRKLTVDHIVPISRGGRNTIDNLQPLCMPCNRRKRANAIDYRPAVQAKMDM